MKILIANNFYYNRGGDTEYAFNLADLLRSKGHEVRFFSMKHPKNLRTDDERYFVDFIDYKEMNGKKNLTNSIRVLKRSIYYADAQKKIRWMLDEFKPEIVHLQNIHAYLTPSIIAEIKRKHIPICWTLHDYKLICPDSHLLSNGRICEDCKTGLYHCFLNKCKKNSYSASLVAAVEAYVHSFMRISERIDLFLSPSHFVMDKFKEFNKNWNRIEFLRNFLPRDKFADGDSCDGSYILYFGQLEPWKGVFTLLRASRLLNGLKLRIVGEGGEKDRLVKYVQKNGIKAEFSGYLRGDTLKQVVKNSSVVVVPSESYETCSFTVMEAMALGKPVIGTDLGGIPELIEDGRTGLLFKMGDPMDLADKLKKLLDSPELKQSLGKKALEKAENEFGAEHHYSKLYQFYRELV